MKDDILQFLSGNGGKFISDNVTGDIAEGTGLDNKQVSGALGRLQDEGYIGKTTQGKRTKEVWLTPKGHVTAEQQQEEEEQQEEPQQEEPEIEQPTTYDDLRLGEKMLVTGARLDPDTGEVTYELLRDGERVEVRVVSGVMVEA